MASFDKSYTIVIVAGEVSGDILGETLIASLKKKLPGANIVGLGGPLMAQSGQTQWFDNSIMAVWGISEVFKNLRKLLQLRQSVLEKTLDIQADLFIGIDAPDFNLKLEKKLLKKGFKTIHYVSPSIWAWRPKRVFKIIKSCHHMMCLFPFEPSIYHQHQFSASFVGHPLAKSIPLQTNQSASKQALGLQEHQDYLAILPGSRVSELKFNLPILLKTCALYLHQHDDDIELLIPVAHPRLKNLAKSIIMEAGASLLPRIHLIDGQAQHAMSASKAVFLSSGTATLEAMLLKTPMIIMYRVNWLTAYWFKLTFKSPWVSLPNALANQTIVPEFLQVNAEPTIMANELNQLLNDAHYRQQQLTHFQALHEKLIQGKNPADIAIQYLQGNDHPA